MRRFRDAVPVLVFALLLGATSVLPAWGQDEGHRGDRRPRMDWQSMTQEQQDQMRERFEQRREEMRKEQNERMREDLQLSEEEYGAIQPMIERVQQLARESLVVGRGLFGNRDRGRGGPGGGSGGGGRGWSQRWSRGWAGGRPGF